MLKFFCTLAAIIILTSNLAFAKPAPDKTKIKPIETTQNILPKHEHTEKCNLTSAEPVQIICILDRSGSMRALAEDTIGGYNTFIENQKKESGKAEVTTILFDDKYDKITDAVDLQEMTELTSAEYYARGTTALLDSVGRTIMEIAGKMESKGICPAKRRVIIMMMTDGKENASREYNKAAVKSLIEQTAKDYGWNYIFMGANIDAVTEADSIGIKKKFASNYSHNDEGVAQVFGMMNRAAKEVREKGKVEEDWKN